MQFRIGPFRYRLRITEGQLYDIDNVPHNYLHTTSLYIIWVSGALLIDDAEEALFHGLMDAWKEHFGWPRGYEERIQVTTCFYLDIGHQYAMQGGTEMLQHLLAKTAAMPPALQLASNEEVHSHDYI